MIIYSVKTVYLLLYLFIASQGMFYLIGINEALHNISVEAFIEQRKAIDSVIGNPLRFLYFSSLGLAAVILLSTVKNPTSVLFLTVLISLICLVADLYFAISKSIPLNQIINQYSPETKNIDYEMIRTEWLSWIKYRGIIAITGLLALLSGYVLLPFINKGALLNN